MAIILMNGNSLPWIILGGRASATPTLLIVLRYV
jgi:hypothetical protein